MAAETHPRRRAALAGLTLAALALTGCSGDGGADAGAGASSSAGGSSVQPPADHASQGGPSGRQSSAAPSAGLLELGDREDQTMAEAAAARAAQFGFTRQQAVTPEEIAAAREDRRVRQSDAGRTTVQPAECKAPLAALDFSPILLEQDAVSRVDVGADTFAGTGTVEVATLDGPARQEVEKHLQTVNALLAGCSSMTMTVQEGGTSVDYRLTTAKAELSQGSPAQSGIVWQRSRASAPSPETTAQVLTAVTSDAVVMVSFTGQEPAGQKQFALMAEEILAAAIRAG